LSASGHRVFDLVILPYRYALAVLNEAVDRFGLRRLHLSEPQLVTLRLTQQENEPMQSPPVLITLTGLGFGLFASQMWAQPAPLAGLVVERTAVVDRQISVTVRNTSSQRITAWGVRGQVTYDSGKSETVETYFDGAITGFPDGPVYKARTFDPGTSLTRSCGIVLGALVTEISLAPSVVVFEDRTAAGDERIIRNVFDYRARERQAMHAIDKILFGEASSSFRDTSASVARLQSSLAAVADDATIRDSFAYRSVTQDLSLALRLEPQDETKLQKRLREILEAARARLVKAEEHYKRR
jgi:hypothetical protein